MPDTGKSVIIFKMQLGREFDSMFTCIALGMRVWKLYRACD